MANVILVAGACFDEIRFVIEEEAHTVTGFAQTVEEAQTILMETKAIAADIVVMTCLIPWSAKELRRPWERAEDLVSEIHVRNRPVIVVSNFETDWRVHSRVRIANVPMEGRNWRKVLAQAIEDLTS